MAYTTRTVQGRHTTPTGTPDSGKVTIRPSTVIRDLAGAVVLAGHETVDLDATGAWSIDLPVPGPDLNDGEPFYYAVAPDLAKGDVPPVTFELTPGAEPVDFSGIVQVTPVEAVPEAETTAGALAKAEAAEAAAMAYTDTQLEPVTDELTGRLSEAGLNAAYASKAENTRATYLAGRSVIFAGDSLTATGDDFDSSDPIIGNSIGGWATLTSGGRFFYQDNAGVAGDTSAQLLARLQVDVIDKTPDVCVVMIGTNDARGDTPLSTYAANVTAIVTALRESGIAPVLRLVPPIGTATIDPPVSELTVKAAVQRYNAWLREFCSTERVPLDPSTYTSMVDPVTGNILAAYDSGDQIHFNPAGNKAAGINLWPTLEPMFANAPADLAVDAGDPLDLLGGVGLFLTDTAGLGTGWAKDSSGVTSIVTSPGVVGRMQRVESPGLGWQAHVNKSVSSFSVGDVLELSGVVSNVESAGHTAQIMLQFRDGADADTGSWRPVSITLDLTEGAFIRRITVPAGSTYAILFLFAGPSPGHADFGQLRLRNLTAQGIV